MKRLHPSRHVSELSSSTRPTDIELSDLADEAWKIFNAAAAEFIVVEPGLPILFLGDTTQYARSQVRLLTVGLNPDRTEFPISDPLARFPSVAPLLNRSDAAEFIPHYLQALNRYFTTLPNTDWPARLEPFLNGMEASFYGKRVNTALHTHLFSPVATMPRWTELPFNKRIRLEANGMLLWHQLVDRLQPDVLIVSCGEDHLENILFPPLTRWRPAYTVEGDEAYEILHSQVSVHAEGPTHVLYGRASSGSFDLVSDDEKRAAGAALIQVLTT